MGPNESSITGFNATFGQQKTHGELHYDSLYRFISVLTNVVIFAVGITGNTLVVLVVVRIRSMWTPTNCYLISLAIADILVLLSATLPAIPETFFQINEWPFGRVLCSLLVFLQYLGVDMASLSITAFTMERYIAICHPLRSHRICTVNRAKRIIAGIWTFGILYCTPWLGLTNLIEEKRNTITVQLCQIRLKREQYLAYYLADFILFYIIPLLISAILYGLIARMMFKTNIGQNNSGLSLTSNRNKERQMTSRLQVVRMLAVIVVVFMVTWMPYRTMVVYNSIAREKYLDFWFLMFCRTMVYINSAINPILYNAMSIKFRHAFQRVLCCCKAQNYGHMSVYSDLEHAIIISKRQSSDSRKPLQSHFNGHIAASSSHNLRRDITAHASFSLS